MEIAFKIDSLDDFDRISQVFRGSVPIQWNPVDKKIFKYCVAILQEIEVTECHRIVYGSEFCHQLLPTTKQVKGMIQRCQEMKMEFTLVTPRVNLDGMNRLKKLLNDLKEERIEIEINDVGVLYYINQHDFPNWSLVLGRTFDQTFHDGRLSYEETKAYYGISKISCIEELPFCSRPYQNFLIEQKIGLCAIDYPNLERETGSGFGVYFPYAYMTTGGKCKMRCLGQKMENKFSIDESACTMQCKSYVELMDKREIDISDANREFKEKGYTLKRSNLYRKGNTVFYVIPWLRNEKKNIRKNIEGFDRIIIQMKLML